MLQIWDLTYILLAAAPSLLLWAFRRRAERRGATTATLQGVLAAAGLLILGPTVYTFAVLIPRLDALHASKWPGMAYVLGGLLVLPATALLLMLWQAYYADRLIRETQWSLRQYLGLNLRVLALIIVPIVLVGAIVTGILMIPGVRDLGHRLPAGTAAILGVAGLMILMGLITILIGPLSAKWLLKTKPLSDRELKARLTALGERLGVGISDIRLMANPGAKMANATVTGFARRQVSVILTDHMLEHMTPAEIEAIFAHECGHLRLRHLWARLGVQLVSMLLFGGLGAAWATVSHHNPRLLALFFVLVSVLPSVAVGPVLRRQEFAADCFAGAATNPLVMASALEKLEQLNWGARRGRMPSWLQWLQAHPTTELRVARLRSAAASAAGT